MNTKFFVPILLLGFSLFLLSFQNSSDWPVPEKYQKMKNPVPADKESISIGKNLFSTHCKSCHGKEGYGDGPKAAQLETPCGDFTIEAFQKQPDGSIFYKTMEGRDDMPSFKKKIPDQEDIWHLVNFLRTLKE